MSEPRVKLALVAKGEDRIYTETEFAECDRAHSTSGWPLWKEDEGKYNKDDKDAFRRYEFTECRFPKRLTGVRFIKCTFTECDFGSCYVATAEFYQCTFHECRFEYAAVLSTKLKFNIFRRCNFTGAFILRCDLYRSFFEQGNVFQHAQLGWVSITRGDLSGAGELRRASLLPLAQEARKLSPNALAPEIAEPADAATRFDRVKSLRDEIREPFIQENADQYPTLLGHTETAVTVEETLAALVVELEEVYRMLSAVWMVAAAYDDAAWAYRESKKRARASLRPRRRVKEPPEPDDAPERALQQNHPPERTREWWKHAQEIFREWRRRTGQTLTWLGLVAAGPACGFGTRLRGVFACLGGWVALFTLTLLVCGAVRAPAAAHATKALLYARARSSEPYEAAGLLDCFRYSIGQLVTTPPQSLKLAGRGWEIAASIETLVGIGLLGLLGFVLANRLRFS
jgi:hypothetical protein